MAGQPQNDKSTWTLTQRWRHFLYGDPGLTKERLAEVKQITDPHDRMVWYMTHAYDHRDIGFFRTQRPLRSPRMNWMLSDREVAPLVHRAIEEAAQRASIEANAVWQGESRLVVEF